MYHTHWDIPRKTIFIDAFGNRVDNSSDPRAMFRLGVHQTRWSVTSVLSVKKNDDPA